MFTSTPIDQVEIQLEGQLEANRHVVSPRCLDDTTMHHYQRQQFEGNRQLPHPMHGSKRSLLLQGMMSQPGHAPVTPIGCDPSPDSGLSRFFRRL